VAQWVFGIMVKDNADGHELVKKLIHGACEMVGNDIRNGNRIDGTGLKHFAYNKIYPLCGQATYFNGYPCLLIIPILELEQAMNWNGQGYEAVVMIDKKIDSQSNLGNVAKGVAM
jgi:hypothetical protein